MENMVLKKLDFAPGIRAKDVNDNFEVVHEWFRRERRHVAGYGLESGFDITVDVKNFTVTIGEGIMVNPEGEEYVIKQHKFTVGPPEYIKEVQKIKCPKNGILKLWKRPYSPSKKGNYSYNPPADSEMLPETEFYIECKAENSKVYYTNVDSNKIYVSDPGHWSGKELTVTYYSAKDRVDSILLHKNGTYYYAKSIVSTNPSHVNLEDSIKEERESYMLVGVIQWIIGKQISAKVYDNHRTYRRVYVDDQNRLFLNGKLYVESQYIYIVKPLEPEPYDFWYDTVNNILYVWVDNGGVWEWVQVNDTSISTIRETKMWTPSNWPTWSNVGWNKKWPDWPFNEDDDKTADEIKSWKDTERKKVKNQLFLFGEDEVDLNFVPGRNELIVIVDNVILMKDQYDEVISGKKEGQPDYMATGIGFKLKKPLDHSAYVQVIVNHATRTKPAKETFQRAAIFVDEGYAIKAKDNTNNVFKTAYPFVVGTGQLEVWVNGVRVTPRSPMLAKNGSITGSGNMLIEMLDASNDATSIDLQEHQKSSYYFRIQNYELKEGAEVSWRINKYIWSYDQVAQLIKDMDTDIKTLKKDVKELKETTIPNLQKNLGGRIGVVEEGVNELRENQVTSDNIMSLIKDGVINVTKLNKSARDHLVNKTFNYYRTATNIVSPISGLKSTDYIQIHAIKNDDSSQILVQGQDYTLKDTTSGLQISLSTDYAAKSQYTFYVTGFTLGA